MQNLNFDLQLQLSDYLYSNYVLAWLNLFEFDKDLYSPWLYTLRKNRYILTVDEIEFIRSISRAENIPQIYLDAIEHNYLIAYKLLLKYKEIFDINVINREIGLKLMNENKYKLDNSYKIKLIPKIIIDHPDVGTNQHSDVVYAQIVKNSLSHIIKKDDLETFKFYNRMFTTLTTYNTMMNNTVDSVQESFLSEAIYNNAYKIVKYLISNYPDLLDNTDYEISTLRMARLIYEYKPSVAYIIKNTKRSNIIKYFLNLTIVKQDYDDIINDSVKDLDLENLTKLVKFNNGTQNYDEAIGILTEHILDDNESKDNKLNLLISHDKGPRNYYFAIRYHDNPPELVLQSNQGPKDYTSIINSNDMLHNTSEDKMLKLLNYNQGQTDYTKAIINAAKDGYIKALPKLLELNTGPKNEYQEAINSAANVNIAKQILAYYQPGLWDNNYYSGIVKAVNENNLAMVELLVPISGVTTNSRWNSESSDPINGVTNYTKLISEASPDIANILKRYTSKIYNQSSSIIRI